MAGPISLGDIVGRLGGECVGDSGVRVARVASLRSARAGDIGFLTHARHRADLDASAATAVILPPSERDATARPRIVAGDPYLYFARVATLLNPAPPLMPGVHEAAVVDAAATVAPTARVDAGAVVEAGARVGEGAWIGAQCWIGAGAVVGTGTRLYGGVRVYPGCTIGERTIVHAGAVIGADGFGYAPDAGSWFKIPQLGRVVVGNDVEIGANTTIDRGALDDTVIEDGVKLDNQIQIAHNCRIGAHTAIAACVGIAGSTTIGRGCMIGGATMIAGHLVIADRVVIAAGTGVNKSLPAPGMYASALPAMPAALWRRMVARVRNLDSLAERLRRLEGERGHKEDGD